MGKIQISTKLLACTLLWLLAVSGAAGAACQLTGNIDADLVGQPGVIVRDSASLGYPIGSPPLSQKNTLNHDLLVPGAVVPSGFHVSRIAVSYDCITDTMCVGYDLSNESTLDGMGTGLYSRAWDADGNGDPCAVASPLLAMPGELDPLQAGSDDLPRLGKLEKYDLLLDLNRDGIMDALLSAFDNGQTTAPNAVDFPGPCGHVVHVTLKGFDGSNLLAVPGVSVSIAFGQDIEFRIIGLSKAPLSTPPVGVMLSANPMCDISLRTFADSDLDASPESSIEFGRFTFSGPDVDVTCEKTVDNSKDLRVCELPRTVAYKLCATNTSAVDIPVTIHIVDPAIGVDETFPNVAKGQQVCVTKEVSFDASYCGHEPVVNTMTATAVSECCGPKEDTCTSSATVRFPEETDVSVTCDRTVDGVKELRICQLPKTVVYKLCATNTSTSDSLVKIRITDTDLGIDETFEHVAKGAQVCVTREVPYDASFCGHEDVRTTMTAVVTPDDGCFCGTGEDSCTDSTVVRFPTRANITVSCDETVDGRERLQICELPKVVVWKACATNTSESDTPVTIHITDPVLGIDETFTHVAGGQQVCVTREVPYDSTFCGSAPVIGNMRAVATAEGDCLCTATTAECTDSATVSFPTRSDVSVACDKTADGEKDLQLCKLPHAVVYKLCATNTSTTDTRVTIRITDAALGIDQTFHHVAMGVQVCVTKEVAYDGTFCGAEPIADSMSATASAEDDCLCGVTEDTCTDGTTVRFPKPGNVKVSCSETVDGLPGLDICQLPKSVVWKLCATNDSTTDTPVTIRLADSVLGIDQTFQHVARGQQVCVTKEVVYDSTFCGHDLITGNMAATATAEEACLCGTTDDYCTAAAAVRFPERVEMQVACEKTVDDLETLRLCELPRPVTYKLCAINTSPTHTPATIRIVDEGLGIDETFKNVAHLAQVCVTREVMYDMTFCGAKPVSSCMTATATAEGDCVCGTTSDTCSDCTTVEFPTAVDVSVSCDKTANGVKDFQICRLPSTVTYRLCATNTSTTDVPVTIRVTDSRLGVDQTFTSVARGQQVCVTKQVVYDQVFCGDEPLTSSMTATATVEGDCLCGTTRDTCTDGTTVRFPGRAYVEVRCSNTVDNSERVQICQLPRTVVYRLCAVNASETDTPCTIRIVDSQLGVSETFEHVARGQQVCVTKEITYDTHYCGDEPITNTMTATATAEGDCLCGDLSDSCMGSSTVEFPREARVDVACEMTADGVQYLRVCELPKTVVWKLCATNTSDTSTPCTIQIVSAALGVDKTFTHVANGQKVCVTKEVMYDSAFCGAGSADATMTATATAEGECVCGKLDDTCDSGARVTFPERAEIGVQCSNTADGLTDLQLCELPHTVVYTLRATNISPTGTPGTIHIVDSVLGVDRTFVDVEAGETVHVTKEVPYDAAFCGASPATNTMMATIKASGECVCGVLEGSCEASSTVRFPARADVQVTCDNTADGIKDLQICELPHTVAYKLCATNTSATGTPGTIHIVDATLGVDETFTGVAAGQTVCVTREVPYDVTYCGGEPVSNTMTATIKAEGDCICGVLEGRCEDSSTVRFPTKADIRVTCDATVDGLELLQICQLPKTVVWKLCATNTSTTDTPCTIHISDTVLGIDQTFLSVARGQTVCATKEVSCDEAFCGSEQVACSMTATATAEGQCLCGNLNDRCTDSAAVRFPAKVDIGVDCNNTADAVADLQLCELPHTVVYRLCATNTSATGTPGTIRIVDAVLGVDETFTGVAAGQTVCVTREVTYDDTFCGAAPVTNSMTATIEAEGDCICGVLDGRCEASSTVRFSGSAEVQVSCEKTVDGVDDLEISQLPKTVVYKLHATNTSATDTPATIHIVSTDLGVDQKFEHVAKGQKVTVTKEVTYDVTYRDHEPMFMSASATAVAEGDCLCNAPTADCSDVVCVRFPSGCEVGVTCDKLVNGAKDLLITNLPTTVTYTLMATNTGTCPATIRIQDPALKVDETFQCVPPGQTVAVTRQVTYDSTYWEHMAVEQPVTVTADATDCATGMIDGASSVTCTSSVRIQFPGMRTPGFWKAHPDLLAQQLQRCGPWNFGCVQVTTLDQVLALLWDDVSQLRDGKRRSSLGRERMKLAFQLAAAYANTCAWSQPPVDLSAVSTALAGTNITVIQRYQQTLDWWNNQGAESPIWNPGTGDPTAAQAMSKQSDISQGDCFD